MPKFSGWEVGTDIHLMHDIIESWFHTFTESYRFTQYYKRDLITVEFDPRGRSSLSFDQDKNIFRVRADFRVTYGRDQFTMENVDFQVRPVFSNAQFFKFELVQIDVTDDKVRIPNRSGTSARDARDWVERTGEKGVIKAFNQDQTWLKLPWFDVVKGSGHMAVDYKIKKDYVNLVIKGDQ